MVRKRGLDVRNGNWVFYDDHLLAAESLLDAPTEIAKTKLEPVSPDQLGEIVSENESALRDAGDVLYQKNGSYPWLHTVKLATYLDTFTTGLVAKAEAIDPAVDPAMDTDYRRNLIREVHYPYLDALENTAFTWRVPGRMQGWNETRDGLWLQIMPREYREEQLEEQREERRSAEECQNWLEISLQLHPYGDNG